MTFSKDYSKINMNGLISVDIQIENGQYRKSIVGKKIKKDILLPMFESIGWFDKNWTNGKNKPYSKYDHKDKEKTMRWYQYEKNNKIKSMSYSELIDKIIKDLERIIPEADKL